ncbi:uncharacterized protein LOC126675096 [Mercurialis annua]|uniref:uncharacterized protein LOC126675096 n=1 Tax=Mercurialis annua TaxID=3986 RepID=UPI00215EA5A7|nr:uncharacterized protein LOC126675096 [Mercurialis annua]
MGQGEEIKTRSDPKLEIQERGEIFFFYRPKVEKQEAHSAEDVQRLYLILRPESGERSVEEKQQPREASPSSSSSPGKKHTEGGHGVQEVNIEKEALLRFIVMGRKSLPDPVKKSRPYWGFVDLVTTEIDQLKDALGGEEYDTSTRGHRHKFPARPVGEGIYRILRHYPEKKSMHTHLVYKLELPPENKENEPQHSLNIEREASYLIQIKNPEQQSDGGGGFRGLQSKRKAMFPAHLQGQFGHKRFSPADPPDFLNYEGCEFLLISASDDIEDELGLELKTEGHETDPSCSDLVKTLGDSVTTTTELFEGTWA